MTANNAICPAEWSDPDDAPNLPGDFGHYAEYAVGGIVIRPRDRGLNK